MNNTLYYKGYTQYHNIGDQLINKSLLDHFRNYANIIISDDKMPLSYLENLDISQNERVTSYKIGFHKKLIIDAINSSLNRNRRVYFLASPPGHQFENSFVTGCKYLLSAFFYMFLYLLGVRIIKIGFSIGPLSPMGKFGERFRALFIKYYFVRDSISLNFVHNIGIKKAKFFPDLCWSYRVINCDNPILTSILNNNMPKIVLSFRDAVHGEQTDNSYSNSLLIFIEKILEKYEKEYTFEISYQVASDLEFSRTLYNKFKDKFRINFKQEQIDLAGATYYHSTAFVLTNRLHVALLAYKFGCLPAVVTDIKEHVKINGIFSDANLEDLLINTKSTLEESISKLDHVLNHKYQKLTQLKEIEESYHLLSDKIITSFFS